MPMGILPTLVTDTENIQDTIIKQDEQSFENKKTFCFNFETGDFETDVVGNALKTTNQEELLRQTVNKILHTARYKFLIYSDDYGNEVDYVLAQDDPPEVVEMELKRVYTEALIYHPLIANVGGFYFEHEDDAIYCSFVVEGKYGDKVGFREEVKVWSERML